MSRGENAPPPDGWRPPSRELTYPPEWRTQDDDPENLCRGEN